ncbi:MAG: DciA family protein [bacterium]
MKGIEGLISGAMDRHGFGRQIQSALVVEFANHLLDEIIESHIRHDFQVVSFNDGELKVACKHSAATHHVQSIKTTICSRIEVQFPTVTVSAVRAWINPDPQKLCGR